MATLACGGLPMSAPSEREKDQFVTRVWARAHMSWDDALPAFASALAAATPAERIRMWNTLQRVASQRVPGMDKLSRLPWPQAWLQLTPDDLLEVCTQPRDVTR